MGESVAEAIVAQQCSLDSLAKVVLDNRVAPDYLLAEQVGTCAMATCCTSINTSEEVETQLHKITEQATWLEGVTPLTRSSFYLIFCVCFFGFFTYVILIALGFGDNGFKVHSKHWELSCL